MGLRISTNIAAMSAARALSSSSNEQAKSYQRLASGNRITSAGDDAAGLSISEKLKSQIRSLGQAERNANDGVSFTQVAEGGLNEIGNMLVRIRELGIQAASDTIGDTERGFVDKEVQQLKGEINRIANVTTFNGTPLLNGEGKKDLSFQVGASKADAIAFNPENYNARTDKLGIDGIDYTSSSGARDSLDKVDDAISKVSGSRADLGAQQNKLQATISNLAIQKENYSAANSRIRDTDVASESSKLVSGNILQQAGVSVLSQANMAPQAALKLLG
ncbi:MAG: flagellin FliC [Cryobacterium sp.]|nr:flagellin FliC [Oligoflexia bacterium]